MIQAGTWQDASPPAAVGKRVFVWCSHYGYETEVWRGPVHLFSSTSLWHCEAADQDKHFHLSPSHLKTWCLFLLSGGKGSCGSVSHYSSVKCCLWILDEQWVLTDGVRNEVSESCCSAIQVLEGCHNIPPKPSLPQPGQVCFHQHFLTVQVLQLLEPSCCSSAERVPVVCKFIIFWEPGEDLHNTVFSSMQLGGLTAQIWAEMVTIWVKPHQFFTVT